jgi:hypothetical protein
MVEMSDCPDTIDFRIYCQWCFVQAHQGDPSRTCRDCRQRLAQDPNTVLKQELEALKQQISKTSSMDDDSESEDVEPSLELLNLFNQAEQQNQQMKFMYEQHQAMKLEYERTIELQNKVIEQLQSRQEVHTQTHDQKTLSDIAHSIISKPIDVANQVKPEIEQLKTLVMSNTSDEDIKKQILDRAERLADLKKDSLKPTRIEELAKPKEPRQKPKPKPNASVKSRK